MATLKYSDHPEVVSHSYKGLVVRFRNVEGDIYIPVVDVRNLLSLGSGTIPVYQLCASCARIEFYKNGSALQAIQPFDIINLAKRGVRASINDEQKRRIAWLKEKASDILSEEQKSHETLKIFSHPDFGDIRSVPSEDGQLFCLADVCKALEIGNPRQVKVRLDEADTQLIDLHAVSQNDGPMFGNTKATFINESALYEVILRSDAPKAKPFRRWVTKEVLPSIRKTGGYVVVKPDDTPEIIMARGLMAAKEALDRMEQRALNAEYELLQAEPKVKYYNVVVADKHFFSTQMIAAELGITYPTLRARLYKDGIVTSIVGRLKVTPGHESWGQFKSPENKRGRSGFAWNKKGRDAIFDLIDPNMPK